MLLEVLAVAMGHQKYKKKELYKSYYIKNVSGNRRMPPCGVMQKIIKTVLSVTKLGNLGQKKAKDQSAFIYTWGGETHNKQKRRNKAKTLPRN